MMTRYRASDWISWQLSQVYCLAEFEFRGVKRTQSPSVPHQSYNNHFISLMRLSLLTAIVASVTFCEYSGYVFWNV